MEGGGVLIYVKEDIGYKKLPNIDAFAEERHYEITAIEIRNPNIIVLCVYRAPNSQLNLFFEYLTKL